MQAQQEQTASQLQSDLPTVDWSSTARPETPLSGGYSSPDDSDEEGNIIAKINPVYETEGVRSAAAFARTHAYVAPTDRVLSTLLAAT